jgi:hypothetical protein
VGDLRGYCERLWRLKNEQAHARQYSRFPELAKIDKKHAELRKPQEHREYQLSNDDLIGDVQDWLRVAAKINEESEKDLGVWRQKIPRVFPLEIRVPQGVHLKIIEDLAQEFSVKLGKPLTARRIQRCIDEWSAVYRRINEEQKPA